MHLNLTPLGIISKRDLALIGDNYANLRFKSLSMCLAKKFYFKKKGEHYVYGKAQWWWHPLNKGPRMRNNWVQPCILGMSATHGLLHIIKHETKFIMNQGI
jgi:hypothetical protein